MNLKNNVCINKRYEGSTAITQINQLKKDIKTRCFNPNDVPAIPTSTTPNPMEVKQIECKEKNTNLTIELKKANEDLYKIQTDLMKKTTTLSLEMNKTKQELSDAKEQHERELKECDLKTNDLIEKMTIIFQIGNNKLYDELKQLKEEQKKEQMEVNQQHKEKNELMKKLLSVMDEQRSQQTEPQEIKLKLKETQDDLIKKQKTCEITTLQDNTKHQQLMFNINETVTHQSKN